MISFLLCIVLLILGYIFYGKFVEKQFGIDPSRKTPAFTHADGVDYVPLPSWKSFMIQFLNIAGTGPIFGAIMGAMFGPMCFIWIVIGSIFAGCVHDYMVGMMCVREGGQSYPNVVGHYLGKNAKNIMLFLSLLLLLFVGPVFIYSPSVILGHVSTIFPMGNTSIMVWMIIIFVYYIISTVLPIDKTIAKLYPIFAVLILFMAIALGGCLLVKWPAIPEIWDGLYNRQLELGRPDQHLFPCLFITLACGAISGFHSTQSPLISRCVKNERRGRPVFYGAMIAEGIVALIWAAVASWFFFDGGKQEIGSNSIEAMSVVTDVSKAWLGELGGFLAIIGVVVAPITSGDTSFRSARLIIADAIGLDQKKASHRLAIAVPMFIAAFAMVWFNIAKTDAFNILWRYFGLTNQMLASGVLWSASIILAMTKHNYAYLMSFIPACFMTTVCICFIMVDKTCFGLPTTLLPGTCILLFALYVTLFFVIQKKYNLIRRI